MDCWHRLRPRITRARLGLPAALLVLVVLSAATSLARAGSPGPAEPVREAGRVFDTVVVMPSGDAVGVAVGFARLAFPDGATQVLLGRDDLFADSLSSGVLQSDSPLLLTTRHTLSPETKDEIRRLGADRVVLLGGTAAITETVADELADMDVVVSRIAGRDRVETAVAVARQAAPSTAALLVQAHGSGADPSQGWADALGAGAHAAASGQPVLLTDSDRLSPVTAEWAVEANISEVTIIGGTAAVGPSVEADLRALGIVVDRASGPERSATAVAIARQLRGFRNSAASGRGLLVDGTRADAWATGFSSAAYSARHHAPLLLARGAVLPADTASWLLAGGSELLCGAGVEPSACAAAADPPGGLLRARVVDVTGEALSGVAVVVRGRGVDVSARTGGDGHIALFVPGGIHQVVVGGRRCDIRRIDEVVIQREGADLGDVVVSCADMGVGEQPPATDGATPSPPPTPIAGLGQRQADGRVVPVTPALFTLADVVPGHRQVRSATIVNTGDVPLRVGLAAEVTGDLAGHLTVMVVEQAPAGDLVVFDGTLAELDRQDLVGDWSAAPGAQRRYRIVVALPPGTDDRAQGLAAAATFTWSGVGP